MRFLGNLLSPAVTSVNNQTTAVPFAIPVGCPALEFRTTAADVVVEVGNNAASPATFATTAAHGFPLSANVAINLDLPPFNSACSPVCAALSTAGASVQVWALWGA